ncbi:MAG: hypothetical protein ACHP7N_13860 [Caulobacterales bacterium]
MGGRDASSDAAGLERLAARGRPLVQLYVSPACARLAGRIELSAGTRGVTRAEIREGGYEAKARLPLLPWRAPNADEMAKLVSAAPPVDLSGAVCLVRPPGAFAQQRRSVLRKSQGADADALTWLGRVCSLGEPLGCIGATSNAANLTTVTFDHAAGGHYIGLHVDNWDGLDLEVRRRSTNRICVNIGEDDRYILFLPITLETMGEMLAEAFGEAWTPAGRFTLIGREFMTLHPDTPVVRCRIAPGEAYIAPTENLVHDASSEGQRTLDEQFTVRGHIGLRRSPSLGLRAVWGALRGLGGRER